MRVRHVILDRDGVLNEEAPARGYITRPEDWRWIPGSLEALESFARNGVRVSIATNQSGIGRGLITSQELDLVHARMTREAEAAGGHIDALLVCTHAPEAGCACRKPAPGLIEAAIAASGVPAGQTLVVGDDGRDLEAGRRAGVPVALVLTGKGRAAATASSHKVVFYDDLRALARGILAESIMHIEASFEDHARVMAQAAAVLPAVLDEVAAELHDCFARGNKLLACGNGGSAADAEHLVAELVGRYRDERRGLPALNLAAGSATITALANDYGYERVFARQVEALALPGDLLFAISTSGRSPNVVTAAHSARARGCRVVGFTGAAAGPLAAAADLVVAAPSTTTARVQEVHGLCIHAICESLDARLQSCGGRE